jgi:hypothetical protein
MGYLTPPAVADAIRYDLLTRTYVRYILGSRMDGAET